MLQRKSGVLWGALAFLALGLAAQAWAEEEDDDTKLGADVSAEKVHQSFSGNGADLFTALVSPYLQVGGWEVRADLPWQHIKGAYFLNGRTPRVAKLCQYAANNPKRTKKLLERGVITASQLSKCANTNTDVSGDGDIKVYLGYLLMLDNEGRWGLNSTLAYKFANGDKKSGLGSGTRDTSAELSLSGNFEVVTTAFTAGYTFVNPEDSNTGYNNFLYAMADAGFHPTRWLSLGGRLSYQGAGADYLDPVKSATAYLGFSFAKDASAKLFVTKYNSVSGYPDREVGANLGYEF